MKQLIVDPALATSLHDTKTSVRLVDASGRLLGLFTPLIEPARLEPQISEHEIRRRLHQGGGRPLAEILRDLEQQSRTV